MSREQLAKAGITLESVKAMIEGGDYITKIAEEDGKAVAFCMAQVSEKYVFAVFVRPVHENKGYGRGCPKSSRIWDSLYLATVPICWRMRVDV